MRTSAATEQWSSMNVSLGMSQIQRSAVESEEHQGILLRS